MLGDGREPLSLCWLHALLFHSSHVPVILGEGGRMVAYKHYGRNIATRGCGRGALLGIDKRRGGGGGGGLRWEAGRGSTECRMDGRVRMLWHGPGGGRAGWKKGGRPIMGFRGGDTRGGWWEDRNGVKNLVCCCLLLGKGGWDRGFVRVVGLVVEGRDVQYLISCLRACGLPGAPRASRVCRFGQERRVGRAARVQFRGEVGTWHPSATRGAGVDVWWVGRVACINGGNAVMGGGETRRDASVVVRSCVLGVRSLHVGNCRAGLGEVLVF